jgi:putative ABC transport system ATP-binding protein
MAVIIDVQNLVKEYSGTTRAIDNISLSIRKGEWTCITGPSGSGKTTLLNILGCLDAPTSGTVTINGIDVMEMSQAERTTFRRENIGLVFQQFHMVPYLTALENVMLAQYFFGAPDEDRARDMLERVGMGHRVAHYPKQLSGGEQQRVCVARAMVNDPALLLADEPTGNLDQVNGNNVLQLIQSLHEEGHSIVMVTHNLEIAKKCDRIINIIDGKVSSDDSRKQVSVEQQVRKKKQ